MAVIRTYRDLLVWQKAHALVLFTYNVTAKFPSEERYGLVSQMRRAAISVASNIVEGFERKSVKESANFYQIAGASLEELKYQYLLSRDLGYCSLADYEKADRLSNEVGKMLWSWHQSQIKNSKQA